MMKAWDTFYSSENSKNKTRGIVSLGLGEKPWASPPDGGRGNRKVLPNGTASQALQTSAAVESA